MTYEQCLNLTGDQWAKLSENQKIEVLQTIESQMAVESGRSACLVEGRWLYTGEDGIVLGAYNRDSQTISINCSQLAPDSKYGQNSDRIITTTLHEGRHAYQDQVVKGLVEHNNPEEARQWSENLSEGNYISYKENPAAYYNQPVEVDARTFAQERMLVLQEERDLAATQSENVSEGRQVFEQQMNESQDTGYDVSYAESASLANGESVTNGESVGIQNGMS